MAKFVLSVGLLCVAPALAIEIGSITKCQAGAEDPAGDTKVFTVQVCNLFGDTCYMNQVETASADCATKALKLENLKCALFPIMSYKDYDRSAAAKLQVGGLGCSISCSGTDCKFSGGCVSVQCKKGDGFVGVATTKTGNGNARTTGVKDTAAATFKAHEFARISGEADQIKTVFLTRTGDYVATYKQGGSASGTNTYSYGDLPTGDGNNYGPAACPSATQLSSAATATKDELRMCGSTGKWVYFNGVNLLMDKTMYVQASDNSETGVATTHKFNLGAAAFLYGKSNYKSGKAMDDSRKVYLYDKATATGDVLMTSGTITPQKSTGMKKPDPDIAGTWRSYTVVFYCDKYDRTDLTTCPAANRKMFYCADPNPTAQFGASIAGGASPAPAASGSARASMGLLGVVGALALSTRA